jgi:hypothetical protein
VAAPQPPSIIEVAVRRSSHYNLEMQVVRSMTGEAWAMQYEISDPAAVAFARGFTMPSPVGAALMRGIKRRGINHGS